MCAFRARVRGEVEGAGAECKHEIDDKIYTVVVEGKALVGPVSAESGHRE
jgi:hypothetical protein